MRRLKLLLVLVLMFVFVALPVQGAFADVSATDTIKVIRVDFGQSYNFDNWVIDGTGNFNDPKFIDENKITVVAQILGYRSFPLSVGSAGGAKARYMEITLYPGATLSRVDLKMGNTLVVSFSNSDLTDITPTPTPTSTPVPTASPSATPSPTATATTVPTSIPKPTATPTPSETPTPKPTVTPEQPDGDRALLTITFINGTEKEYDLPESEVEAFVNWYDARDAGRGSGMYAIDKHSNNKGPFSKRKNYVVFDKILTFEVSEYTISK
ncbi:hypothetical protein A3842_22505 [Paenibacillus sp. P3E]|uniref:hypothetical protein n=1 Tax=Paenibacillus sp. P3E TaxID=1349435 RepID=UPI00093E536F|nr:hypothetical protein [Paenibacillus sp. P3E]OKP72576.1 hypothetical protein A3842_22505 [Paenibacillus sp. P3E]